jgi:hypothetical protein
MKTITTDLIIWTQKIKASILLHSMINYSLLKAKMGQARDSLSMASPATLD